MLRSHDGWKILENSIGEATLDMFLVFYTLRNKGVVAEWIGQLTTIMFTFIHAGSNPELETM